MRRQAVSAVTREPVSVRVCRGRLSFGGSSFGSRFGATPIPASHPGVASARFRPQSGAADAVAFSGREAQQPQPRTAIPTFRGNVPTRAALAEPAAGNATLVPQATYSAVEVQNLPVAQAVETPSSAPRQLPPAPGSGRWEQPKKAGGISLMLIFLIAALVTAGVYVLGKNFLLPH